MATTGAGTPYVESSDLVANYPAVSESLAERVDLVGVLPFADSTARGTALPSPTDGQYSYLQDTNATEYWDGSAWVAAGVAPGLVHINTTTFSAVSSVSFNSVFTSDYDNYRVVLSNYTASTGAGILVRMRTSGTDNTASSYLNYNVYIYDGGGPAANKITGTYWEMGVSTNGYNSFLSCDFYDPQKSATTGATYQSFGGLNRFLFNGGTQFLNTTVFDGFTVFPTSGNITGTIRVYGYKNS